MSEVRTLSAYLNYHLAGSTAGVSLIRRIARTMDGRAEAGTVRRIATEVAEDRESLHRLMRELRVARSPMRVLVAVVGSRAAQLQTRSPFLSRSGRLLLEVEAMRLGVEGKACMWRALLSRPKSDTDSEALSALLDRAQRQLQALEEIRLQLARETLLPG